MEHLLTQTFELLGIFLAGMVFASKAIPELKRFVAILQISMFLYSLLREYLKRNPSKLKQLNVFVASMMSHYLKTHPHGQALAQETDLDDKVELVLKHDRDVPGVG